MQVEEYDYAIFGSEVDAAFLAALLANNHGARVLLVRDHVNDYALQTHFSASLGASADPDTISVLQHGESVWLEMFSDRDRRECYSKQSLNLKVAYAVHSAALNYIENAMLGVDRQCDRKVNRSGQEYLELRGVIFPDRRKSLEMFHEKAGTGITFADRSEFSEIRRLKNGQLNFKREQQKSTATQTILLDADLIVKEFGNSLLEPLCAATLNTVLIDTKTPTSAENNIFIDCVGCLQTDGNQEARVSSMVESTRFLADIHATELFGAKAMIKAKAQKNTVITRDGAPLLSFSQAKKIWSFAAEPTSSTFLMPSVAGALTGEGDTRNADYWSQRGDKNRRSGDVGVFATNLGEYHADA